MRKFFLHVFSFALIAFTQQAYAVEIKTSCPTTKPGEPKNSFRYGRIWPEGYPTHWEHDSIVRKGELAFLERDFTDFNSAKSILMCEFKDRSQIEIPLPGLLLRCGMTIRNYDSRTKPIQWLDVWCISDDERRPVPNKE